MRKTSICEQGVVVVRFQALTTSVNVKLHEGNWRMYAEIIKLLFTNPTDPCKVSLVEIALEELSAMFKHGLRVVLVESVEEADN